MGKKLTKKIFELKSLFKGYDGFSSSCMFMYSFRITANFQVSGGTKSILARSGILVFLESRFCVEKWR